MVTSYYRNGIKVDGLCLEEFREEFPYFLVEYTKYRQTLNVFLKNLQQTRNASITRSEFKKFFEEVREVMGENPGLVS